MVEIFVLITELNYRAYSAINPQFEFYVQSSHVKIQPGKVG